MSNREKDERERACERKKDTIVKGGRKKMGKEGLRAKEKERGAFT